MGNKHEEDVVLEYFQRCILKNKDEDIIEYFKKAFEIDKEGALKILFYSRDIRGGLGERESFRRVLKYLGENEPNVIRLNLAVIPYYGRWDDLYSLFDTEVEADVIQLFKRQLKIDIESEIPSLLAKWMKSSNTTSKESRYLANKTINQIGLTHRAYRKTLTYLRKKINIVERNLMDRSYDLIDYGKLPVGALRKYKKTFLANDQERYREFYEEKKENDTLEYNNREELKVKLLGVLNLERYNLINVI